MRTVLAVIAALQQNGCRDPQDQSYAGDPSSLKNLNSWSTAAPRPLAPANDLIPQRCAAEQAG
eukprot:687308-Rhodomonas_salina.1